MIYCSRTCCEASAQEQGRSETANNTVKLVQQRSLEKRRTKLRSEAEWPSSGHEVEQPAGCDASKVALDLNPILGGVARSAGVGAL